jgi:hypothetical protein
MPSLAHLFANHGTSSERIRRADPDFFPRLARRRRPRYLVRLSVGIEDLEDHAGDLERALAAV